MVFKNGSVSFSSAVSWSGWDGGTDWWLLTAGSESPRVLLHPRQDPGVHRGCQGEEQGGWVGDTEHPPAPSSQPCHILLRAREHEKPLFKGWGDTMEIRDELEKSFYLVEDSSEKPAGKESTGFA